MLDALLAAGIIHQDPPHGFGGRHEEMAAVVETVWVGWSNEPQVRFMHQRSRLKRLPRLLLSQLRRRQLPELLIHQWQKLLSCLRIALLNLPQDAVYIGHGKEDSQPTRPNP